MSKKKYNFGKPIPPLNPWESLLANVKYIYNVMCNPKNKEVKCQDQSKFDAKKKLIVKHREHTFIEGTKKEINIFLDGMSAVYIIIQNHNTRTKLAQKQAEKTATPKKKEPMAQTRARIKQKPKPKPKEVKH